MARRRKTSTENHPIGVGLTTKQMKKRKPINSDLLLDIDPLTSNQEKFFKSYLEGKNLVAYGVAGTGKTFITLYNALREVLDERTPYEKIYICRSLVQVREIGFLPGNHEDKAALFEIPYKNMVKYMFQMPSDADFEMLYGNIKSQGTISFWSTSFLRGVTLDNSIITRVGENSKIIFCGDTRQSDLIKEKEKLGIYDFLKILGVMPSFDMVEFTIEDVVRSGIVKEYLIAKDKLNIDL